MHRFFCTVCKKVKRVHADPFTDTSATAELALHENKQPIHDRLGVCRWHAEYLYGKRDTRAVVNSRVKVRTPNIKKAKAQPQQKGRK